MRVRAAAGDGGEEIKRLRRGDTSKRGGLTCRGDEAVLGGELENGEVEELGTGDEGEAGVALEGGDDVCGAKVGGVGVEEEGGEGLSAREAVGWMGE
jgi:hypothetical protein